MALNSSTAELRSIWPSIQIRSDDSSAIVPDHSLAVAPRHCCCTHRGVAVACLVSDQLLTLVTSCAEWRLSELNPYAYEPSSVHRTV